MSDEYKFRNINLGKLADFVRTNGGLDETPVLHLLDTIRVMRGRMPDQMQDCTIVFEECEKGHGSLRGTNWIKQGCQQCRIEDLEQQVERISSDSLKALAGTVCTPLEGYRKAGFGWLIRDINQLVSTNAKLVEALTTIKTKDTSTAGVMGTLAEIADEALKGAQP